MYYKNLRTAVAFGIYDDAINYYHMRELSPLHGLFYTSIDRKEPLALYYVAYDTVTYSKKRGFLMKVKFF